ncbi:hypothetical protein TWF696_007981 [Orbilia brochopaga]|uniref:Uncharacterized protein n=1 Tax=Orbilia brochopaga TaxID=3140254 RepID=A0AAV9UQI4_9PEZI
MKVSTIIVSVLLASVSSAIPLAARDFGSRATSTDIEALNHDGGADSAAFSTPNPLPKRQQNTNSLKDLVLSFLAPLNIPPVFLQLIKNAPDSVVQQIMTLPPDQLQNVINQLKEGKIPTVPGIKPKDLVMQFLGQLNIPPNVVQQIQGMPDSVFEQIAQLPFSQLQQVIADLQQGKIPTQLPGVNNPGSPAPAPAPAPADAASDSAPLSFMDIKF